MTLNLWKNIFCIALQHIQRNDFEFDFKFDIDSTDCDEVTVVVQQCEQDEFSTF